MDEALAIIRAARRTRPATPVVCLLPADFPLDAAVGGEMLADLAFAVRRHPVPDDDLMNLVADAVASPRLIAGAVDGDEWDRAEGVA